MLSIDTARSHQDLLIELEDDYRSAATKPIEEYIAKTNQRVAKLWVSSFGSLDEPVTDEAELRRILIYVNDRITNLPVSGVSKVASDALGDGITLGIENATETVGKTVKIRSKRASASLVTDLAKLPGKISERVAKTNSALSNLGLDSQFSDMTSALSHTSDVTNVVDRTVTWLVNSGYNSGVNKVTSSIGYGRVWIAERSGCVDCAAYSGQVTDGDFPGGLTFGETPIQIRNFPDPPLHPGCRCTTEPYSGQMEEGKNIASFPDALKREAERSILKGTSVPSESEKVRLKAAERLLKAGTDLPKSVQASAKKSIRQGSFG